jgi:magnesium-transporting ATPase (P-type)
MENILSADTKSGPAQTLQRRIFIMTKFILVMIAVLSIGVIIGCAYAHDTVYRNGVELWGPPSAGGGGGGA